MTERNKFAFSGFILEKLSCHRNIENFNCGDTDLNEYFQHDSENYKNELLTQTYCFYRINTSQQDAVALVDFCNDSLARAFIPNRSKRQINHRKRGYKSFPAIKITRLGVDVSMQRMNIGTTLLDAIKLFFITDNRTGCRFLTVDAYRGASEFYRRNGFIDAEAHHGEDTSYSPTIPLFFDLMRVKATQENLS